MSECCWNKLQKWSVDNSTFQRWKITQSGAFLSGDGFNSPFPLFSVELLPSSAHSEASEEPHHTASFQSPPSWPYLHFSSSSSPSSMFGWNSPAGPTRSSDRPQIFDILNRGRRASLGKAVIWGRNTIPNQTKWINNRGCRHTFILAVHIHRELVYQPMWSACWHRRLGTAAQTLTVW